MILKATLIQCLSSRHVALRQEEFLRPKGSCSAKKVFLLHFTCEPVVLTQYPKIRLKNPQYAHTICRVCFPKCSARLPSSSQKLSNKTTHLGKFNHDLTECPHWNDGS